jgi:hypothetical protein
MYFHLVEHESMLAKIYTQASGKVMVDPSSYLRYGPAVAAMGNRTPCDFVEECKCRICQDPQAAKWCQEFGSNSVEDFPQELKNEHYLLCPPRVLGYVPEQKMWAQFSVDLVKNIKESELDKAFDNQLAFDQRYKDVVKSLVKNHASEKVKNCWGETTQVEDIVPGKGKGLVILLYGKSC